MRVEVVRALNRRARPYRRRAWAGMLRLAGRREDAMLSLSRLARGMFNPDESRLLYRVARDEPGPGDIAEIGSLMGRSTIVIGLGQRDSGREPCRIYAIDHHEGSAEHRADGAWRGSTLPIFRGNISEAGLDDIVEPLVMTSSQAAEVLRGRGAVLRLLFIDGAHEEEAVRADIRDFVPLVRPGGVVAFHDCERDGGFPGVWRAYHSELHDRSDPVARAESLLVVRLRS